MKPSPYVAARRKVASASPPNQIGTRPEGRARVDANVIKAMEFAGRLGPQRLHDPHLLFRAAPTIVKTLVQRDELYLVPPDADASRNRPPPRISSEAACFATSAACRCARINTPAAKPMLRVHSVRKAKSTNGS